MNEKHPKMSANYWTSRVYFHRQSIGLESDYSVSIQFKGRRERFKVGTANREIAGRIASEIYRSLSSFGWARTVAVYKKHQSDFSGALTIGEYLDAVRRNWPGKQTTLDIYIRFLRQIVSDIENLDPKNKRFDHMSDGAIRWHKLVDRVPLSAITDDKVNKWKLDTLAQAEQTEVARNKRKISINTCLRNARSLFGKRITKLAGLELPSPLPFAGVDFFGGVDQRYFSAFDIRKLLLKAKEKLSLMDPDAYSVVLLAAFAGLRRREIDLLEWPSIDFKNQMIQLRITDYYHPKTSDSLRAIPLRDPSVLDWFKARKRAQGATEGFVIAPAAPYTKDQKLDYYRCEEVLERLTRWLRIHGVKDARPLHALRKEAGSDIVKRAGLISGAAFLRHKSPTVTAMHYSDYRVIETPSFGEEPDNVIRFETERNI
jgi:integrase